MQKYGVRTLPIGTSCNYLRKANHIGYGVYPYPCAIGYVLSRGRKLCGAIPKPGGLFRSGASVYSKVRMQCIF